MSENKSEPIKLEQWSFEKHPHPYDDDHTVAERVFLEIAYASVDKAVESIERGVLVKSCQGYFDADLQVYLDRFPDYGGLGTPNQLVGAWRIQFYPQLSRLLRSCIDHVLAGPFSPLRKDNEVDANFYYCGHFSHAPTTVHEQEFHDVIEEMVEHSKRDRLPIISLILSLHDVEKEIVLNHDVEYYLRKRYLAVDPEDTRHGYDFHLRDRLTPERLAFLEQAVKDGDMERVLDTTEPCPPRSREDLINQYLKEYRSRH